MPKAESWLSLKISQGPDSDPRFRKNRILISIPKKAVALSTRRNRLRRLIKEAVRHDVFFKDVTKNYFFRVTKLPDIKSLKLINVRELVSALKTES